MEHLTLKTDLSAGATSISNLFLDYYMPKASGEYTKVYLYLLRSLQGGRQDLTVAGLADALEILGKTSSSKTGMRRVQHTARHLYPAGSGTRSRHGTSAHSFRKRRTRPEILQPQRTGAVCRAGGVPPAFVCLRTIYEKNLVSV